MPSIATYQRYKILNFVFVKIFLCLFSLYILVLAGVSCRADDDCCTGRRECSQPCSPFFACGGCHGFVVPSAELATPAPETGRALKVAIYKSQLLPDFHALIWQPPRSVMA